MRAKGTCLRCGHYRELKARGLDNSCYTKAHNAGELENYPKRERRHVDLEEADQLARAGRNDTEIALHQGFSSSAVRVARHRRRRQT
ncbi:hypothetical protein [Amycolatopsis sp. NPDC004079]|uniref:hypothetical protein n=1 Tax=Amycolatopsis sp. NPDC004079 TaxID=3154549 RepID=UPI0033ABBBE6